MAVSDEAAEQLEADNAALRVALAKRDAKIAALSKRVELRTEQLNRSPTNAHLRTRVRLAVHRDGPATARVA